MAIVRKCCLLTMAVAPLSLLFPLHHITYANSSEFRNLLKWLRISSLPKQETSYWPLMHDPRNVLEWPHGRFLFGFALPTPMTPGTPPSWSLSSSLHSCTPRDMPLPPSSHTWPESLPFMLPWVSRLVSHDWNAPRFTSFDKDYVASLLCLEAPRGASPFSCFTNSGGPWTYQTAITWLSGQPLWLVSSPSFGHPTSFQEVLGTLKGFYSYDTPTSSSRMREQSLKSDVRKQISSEIGKSVSPFLELLGTYSAPCWPSGPSSKLSGLSHLSPPVPTLLSVGSTTPSC
jgi:hypothetical protein